MPTYEYACSACGHEWEQSQRIIEAPIEVCPKCSASAAHRLISGGTNFILKGGGWYSDLYSSSPKAGAKKPEGSSGGESKAAESSSDTKDSKSTGGSGGSSTDKGGSKDSAPSTSSPSTPASAPSS